MVRHIWRCSPDRLTLEAQPGRFLRATDAHNAGKALFGADAKGFIILSCKGTDCAVCLLK